MVFDEMNSDDCEGVIDEYGKHGPKELGAIVDDFRVGIIRLLGGRCSACDETRSHHLELDHVRNNGNDDKRFFKPGKIFEFYFKRIEQNIDIGNDFQVLCGACNRKKYKENQWLKKQGKSLVEKIDKNTEF